MATAVKNPRRESVAMDDDNRFLDWVLFMQKSCYILVQKLHFGANFTSIRGVKAEISMS